MKKLLAHAIIASFFIASLASPALCQLPAGTIAPDFTLHNLNDKSVRLSDLEGHPVVLVIGTTWCPGCKAQLSELQTIRQFFDDHKIPLIDIFIQEPAATVGNYLKEKKLPETFEALLDDGQVHRAYRVYPIPRVLILDSSRRIVQDSLGLDATEITDTIQRLLDRQADTEKTTDE